MDDHADLGQVHLRVARPTDDLAAVVKFYRDGLGLEVLYEFDHNGFDGVMLGSKGAVHHLEFTRKAGHKAGRAPTEDNLLVFYLPDEAALAGGGGPDGDGWVQTSPGVQPVLGQKRQDLRGPRRLSGGASECELAHFVRVRERHGERCGVSPPVKASPAG